MFSVHVFYHFVHILSGLGRESLKHSCNMQLFHLYYTNHWNTTVVRYVSAMILLVWILSLKPLSINLRNVVNNKITKHFSCSIVLLQWTLTVKRSLKSKLALVTVIVLAFENCGINFAFRVIYLLFWLTLKLICFCFLFKLFLNCKKIISVYEL